MRAVETPEALLADPIGRYLAGASFVVWVQDASRIGMFHTADALDPDDRAVLARVFALPTSAALVARYDLLHDIGTVQRFDERAFAFFEGFLAQWVDAIAQRVRRIAVVRPHGVAGAAFQGMFHRWVVPRFAARLCTSRAEAYEFLDVPVVDRKALDALTDGGGGSTLRRLRDQLMRDLGASIERVASELGVSARTLQRVLREQGTTFRSEVARVRVRLAEQSLLDTDHKIEAIAQDLGFSSASAFVRMFERVNGQTPGEFRRRSRERS